MILQTHSLELQLRRLQCESERGGHREQRSLLQSFVGMAIVLAVTDDLKGFLGMHELCVASIHRLKGAVDRLPLEIILDVSSLLVNLGCCPNLCPPYSVRSPLSSTTSPVLTFRLSMRDDELLSKYQ
jgi:hypothetical protein